MAMAPAIMMKIATTQAKSGLSMKKLGIVESLLRLLGLGGVAAFGLAGIAGLGGAFAGLRLAGLSRGSAVGLGVLAGGSLVGGLRRGIGDGVRVPFGRYDLGARLDL